MKRWIFLAFFSACAFGKNIEHVVIISVDGLRPDAISSVNSPQIDSMRREGITAKKAQTILPSITLPSHTSMLTGRAVCVHRVTWNSYLPEKGIVTVPTCLEIAHQDGKSTAMFVGKEKFKHLCRSNSVDEFAFPGDHAKQVTDEFVNYVKKKGLPNLTFIHLPDTDLAGHAHGWMSSAYMKALKDIDASVKLILFASLSKKYRANTVVILTADHGGALRTHGDDIPVHRLIPWMAVGGPIHRHQEIKEVVTTYDTASTALSLLGIKVPSDWEGKARLTGI